MSRRWRIPTKLRRTRFFVPPSLRQVVDGTGGGIPSAEAFGTGVVNDGAIRSTGIPSAEAFGTGTVTAGTVTISPTGIPSLESFGLATISITFDLTQIKRPVKRSNGYELVCVRRSMQPNGTPTFEPIDSIVWNGLNYTEELSKVPILQASATITSLSEEVIQRLRNMRQLPCELWLYRDGEHIHAGPLTVWNTQRETLTMQSLGLLGYFRYWTVDSDQVFANVDQFTIVKTLIDLWQNSSYGNFGIVTSNVGTSGVTRDATYKKIENHGIGQRIEELSRRENGFDIEIEPLTRELKLWYPTKGIDRSAGDTAVVFDGLSITSTDVAASVAPGDVASDAFGTGTNPGDPIWGTVFDPDIRAQFGRTSVSEAFDGVSEPATLTAHLNGMLNARKDPLLVPGPSLRVVVDTPLSSYSVGDTVTYRLHERLGVEGAFRLRRRSVSVDNDGVEEVTLEFV